MLLVHEHFRRWDRNRDGKLTREEYDFIVETSNQDSPAAFRFADQNHDGGLTPDEVFLDAKPDSKNVAAVLEYNRRKMRSEESFLGADADGNGTLNQTEYPKYERYQQGADEEDTAARPVAAGVASTSEETWTYWIIGLDVLLVVVGGVYWVRRGVR